MKSVKQKNLRSCSVLVLHIGGIYEVRHGNGLRWLDTLLGLIKFGIGVQAVLRFCHNTRNLRCCSVGIADAGFVKYAVEMASANMIYIPSVIKIS
jgi:hypothetical protein